MTGHWGRIFKQGMCKKIRNLRKRSRNANSVLMLCVPVFLFTPGSSALLGRPRCGLSI